jgi:hypothetical protein
MQMLMAKAVSTRCFIPLTDAGPIGHLSEKVKIKELLFRKVPAGYNDLHNAPQKQYVVLLDGGVEIETSTGEKRIFEPGEILLMEDTIRQRAPKQ